MVIPKSKTLQFERDLNNLNWEEITNLDEVEDCCDSMTAAITGLIKFTKQQKCGQKDNTLPWLNNEIRKSMKLRDIALKKIPILKTYYRSFNI